MKKNNGDSTLRVEGFHRTTIKHLCGRFRKLFMWLVGGEVVPLNLPENRVAKIEKMLWKAFT